MPEDDSQPTHRSPHLTRLVYAAWLGYWAFLFVIMHTRRPPGARLVERFGDKVIHAAAYFVLAALGGWIALRRGRPLGWHWVLFWVAVYAAYAAADELLQDLVGRNSDLGDWLADVIGASAGLLLAAGLSRLRKPSI